jgi:hypothetical protein
MRRPKLSVNYASTATDNTFNTLINQFVTENSKP